ncbi:hypothetical protein B0H11DRAFT_1931307, partial [Mycena galericulata]
MPPSKNHKKRKAPARDVGGRQQEIHTHTHTFSVAEITGRNDNVPITTYVDRVSQDNRRGYRETVLVEPPSPVKRQRASAGSAFDNLSTTTSHPHSPDSPFDAPQCYEMGFDADDESPRERRSRPAGRAGQSFGRDTTWYRGCSSDTPAVFRCQNCHGDELYCATCCVDRHVENPLHRIQRWNSGFFEPCTLKELGLRVQLGHRPREVCPEPHQLHTQFVVLHTNGIHEVNVDACDCEHAYDAGTPEIQMMRAGWFPATDQKPRTCATFEVLDQFLMATLQSKTTMYDFYAGLEKLTDNTGNKPPYRYHAFLRMCPRIPPSLMLKRAGRGHDPAGVEATEPGELAIRCPCCPEPGVNLPEDWHSASAEDQYLYILFIALDACFRLKATNGVEPAQGSALGAGWAYLVEHVPYRKFLATATDQKEMNTCSGLAALDHANTKFSRGYYSTGVGMGVCARHEFVQPNGVGDLQKGERYANFGFFVGDSRLISCPQLREYGLDLRVDSAAQGWPSAQDHIIRHCVSMVEEFIWRLRALPPLVRLNAAMALMRFVIPKMHIHSHTLACQLAYSLNLVPGSAQTDGEGIERPWANIGGVATSTREMGPGSREDVLNCHWSHWNWQKLVSLAERLRTRTDRANEEHALQLESFTAFTMQQADRVPAWKKMVEDFERDGKQKNPYEVTSKGCLLRLEEEESRRWRRACRREYMKSAQALSSGLVWTLRTIIRVQIALKKAATTAQKIDVATYTPASLVTLAARTIPESEQVETVPLFLPSALSAQQRAEEPVKGLAVIEDSMRDAQCATALARLRNQLHIKSRLYTYKRLQARNQGSNTRARGIVARNESKIRLHSEKYQMAWEAKRRRGGIRREVGWQLLRKEDIRCMEDAEEAELRATGEWLEVPEEGEGEGGWEDEEGGNEERERRGGENVREVSWIWTGAGTSGTDAELEEALRIEWAKAYARMRRWREETRLLKEEARRLPISLEYRARQWEARVGKVPVGLVPVDYAEGAIAYGMKQAAMYRRIAARVNVTMTEIRRGRGKRRIQIEEDEDDAMDGVGEERGGANGEVGDEDEVGQDEDEEELEDLRDDLSDEDHVLEGGGGRLNPAAGWGGGWEQGDGTPVTAGASRRANMRWPTGWGRPGCSVAEGGGRARAIPKAARTRIRAAA